MALDENNQNEDGANRSEENIDATTKFTRRFIRDNVENKSKKRAFIKEIMKADTTDDKLKEEIKKFGGEYSDLDGANLDGITIGQLQREMHGYYIGYQNKNKKLEERLLSEYEINSSFYKRKLQSSVENLGEVEVDKILDSDIERKKFLEKRLGKNKLPKSKNFVKELNLEIENWNLREKILKGIKNLSEGEQASFMHKFKTNEFDLGDFQRLFNLCSFSAEEKKDLIKTFIPNISLQKAIDLGLIEENSEKVKRIKQNIIKKFWKGGTKSELEELARGINNKDLLVSTKDYLNSDSIHKLEETLPETMFKKIKSGIEEQKEELLKNSSHNLKEFITKIEESEKLKSKITGIGNLGPNAFIEIRLKDKEGKEQYGAYRVKNVDINLNSGEKGISCAYFSGAKKSGEGDKMVYTETQNDKQLSYHDIISNVEKNDIHMNIITNDTLKTKEEFGSIEFDSSKKDLKLKTEQEVEDRSDTISKEIKELKNKLDDVEDFEKPTIEQKIEKLGEEQENLNGYNINRLIEKLDEIDPDGAGIGFDVGTSFFVEGTGKEKGGFWTVKGIVGDKIFLDNNDNQEIDFVNFCKTFRDLKAKRIKIDTSDELINYLSSQDGIADEWSNCESEGGKLMQKGGESKNGKEKIEYLVGDKGENFVKIYSISGNDAIIEPGKIKEQGKDKKDNKKLDKWEHHGRITISLAELGGYIKQHKLKPDKLKGESTKPMDDSERHGSFWSRFFSRTSVGEIIASGKLALDSVENYLKEGQEHNSAKAATGIFSWMLPEEVKLDLKSRVQGEEKKRTDEYMDNKLKSLDSWEATNLILSNLLNKNCSKYKLEAGMLFMYREYGGLYAKGYGKKGLAEYAGTGLWYRALGGTVDDEIWKEAKKQSKDEKTGQNANFTEEFAVYCLIKKQCGSKGHNNIKRRTRLHKEIKGEWSGAIDSELEKGYNDASDTRSMDAINKGMYGEMFNGTHPNAVGWMKKGAERGGAMHDVWEGPIVAMFSGVTYSWDQRMILKSGIKDIRKKNNDSALAIPLFDFMSSPQDTEFFGQVMVELSNELSKIYTSNPDFSKMGTDAQAIFANQKKDLGKKGQGKKIEDTQKFWGEYGEVLTRSLHMLNGGNSQYAKTDKIVELLKDDVKDENGKVIRKKNPVLAKYYNHMETEVSSGFNFANVNYMDDWLKKQGLSGMNTYFAIKQGLEVGTGPKLAHAKVGKFIWYETLQQARSIKNGDSGFDESSRMTLAKSLFRDTIGGIKAAGSAGKNVSFLFSGQPELIPGMKELGLYGLDKDKAITGEGVSIEDIRNSGDRSDSRQIEIDNLITQKANDFLSGSASNVGIESDTSQKIHNILSGKSVDDDISSSNFNASDNVADDYEYDEAAGF